MTESDMRRLRKAAAKRERKRTLRVMWRRINERRAAGELPWPHELRAREK